jgi:hypothetical protein
VDLEDDILSKGGDGDTGRECEWDEDLKHAHGSSGRMAFGRPGAQATFTAPDFSV